MSIRQSEELFYSTHRSLQCGIGNHAWLPWLEVQPKGISDVFEGDVASKGYITRCANCGHEERWNV
jgi:hypothetical protein